MNLPLYVTPFQISVLLFVSIYSAVFHILFGGRRFVTCVIMGAVAFIFGHLMAERLLPQGSLLFGNIHILEASLLSWAAMIGTRRFVK